jgi:hypothetical protein
MREGGGTARSCGMKRFRVEAVLMKNLEPGVWMTANDIVERIHALPTTGVRNALKRNFPPTGRSLSMKLRGSKIIESRIDPNSTRGTHQYRVRWNK